jgi:exodeoxyribonuclease VII large subunit
VDWTVADFVADARASTPTKAGVVAVPDMREVLAELANTERILRNDVKRRLELAHQHLQTILASSVFRYPLLTIRNREQQIDEFSANLADSIKTLLAMVRERLHYAYQQIVGIEPHRLIGKWEIQLNNLHNRSVAAIIAIINDRQIHLTAQANRLIALNPRSVLNRGYSITTNKTTGQVIKTCDDVQLDDSVITELANENFIESKVTKK